MGYFFDRQYLRSTPWIKLTDRQYYKHKFLHYAVIIINIQNNEVNYSPQMPLQTVWILTAARGPHIPWRHCDPTTTTIFALRVENETAESIIYNKYLSCQSVRHISTQLSNHSRGYVAEPYLLTAQWMLQPCSHAPTHTELVQGKYQPRTRCAVQTYWWRM